MASLIPPPPFRAEPIQADGSEIAILAGRGRDHIATCFNYDGQAGTAKALAEFIVDCLNTGRKP